MLFDPDTLAQWPEGLEVSETLLNIKPGKVSKVQVAVHIRTDHDIELTNRAPLGVLQAVKSVIAANVRLSTISKTSASVSSRFPNTRKQMKARGRFG